MSKVVSILLFVGLSLVKPTHSWIAGEFMRYLNDSGVNIEDVTLPPESFAQLIDMVTDKTIGASAASKEGYALFLDCRTLEIQHAPLPEKTSVVILDTSTRRGLVDSAYNERRSQCEEAARWFGVRTLRDVGVEELEKGEGKLSEVVMKRARHIVTENARVLEAVQVMKAGDVKRLGELFNASHASLRDDFEVTNEALNQIVECAQEQPSCQGARMTGAGFGGCAVALVNEKHTREFVDAVLAAYKHKSGLNASLYICKPSAGADIIKG